MTAEFRANDFLLAPDIGAAYGRSHKLRPLLPVLPFACLAAGLALASARSPGTQEPALEQPDDLTSQVPGQVG